MNTGIQRALRLSVTKKISGIIQPGYPRGYDVRNNFVCNENSYAAITDDDFAEMSNADYTVRLSDFKLYVQQQEPGLNIDATQSNMPYLENTIACPIS